MAGSCGPSCGYCGRCERVPWEFTDERATSIFCDWCDKYVWIGKEVLANHGGHFCSDECASLYGESVAAGDITPKESE